MPGRLNFEYGDISDSFFSALIPHLEHEGERFFQVELVLGTRVMGEFLKQNRTYFCKHTVGIRNKETREQVPYASCEQIRFLVMKAPGKAGRKWRTQILTGGDLYMKQLFPSLKYHQFHPNESPTPVSNFEDLQKIIAFVQLGVGESDSDEEEKITEKLVLDREDCCVCLDEPACTRFQPCNHRQTCNGCSSVLKICPLCRASITGTVLEPDIQTPSNPLAPGKKKRNNKKKKGQKKGKQRRRK